MDKVLGEPVERDCFNCETREKTEWCGLTQTELQVLNDGRTTRSYEKGDVIFRQGDPCAGVYCIESGHIGIRKSDSAGNETLLRLNDPGDTFGYRALIVGTDHLNSAEALEASTVCYIDVNAVRTLVESNPALGLRFFRHSVADLDGAEDRIVQMVNHPVRARLAHLLAVLKERHGTVAADGTVTMTVPTSRADMAGMLGIRPETLSRAVRAFEENGLARFNGRSITILDMERLLDEIDAH